MDNILFYLSSGIAFGLAAGVYPGPLTMLIIAETLQHNMKAGLKASIAPLLSDIFIISLCVSAVSFFQQATWIFGALSFAGGCYLLFLGANTFRVSSRKKELSATTKSHSVLKGVVTNLLNPAPYVFWLTIGAPILLKTYHQTPIYTFTYIIGIYTFLIGSKAAVAVIVSQGKGFLKSKAYLYVNYLMGIVLCSFGFIFLWQGYDQFVSL